MRYKTYEWAYKHSEWVQPHAYVFYFIKMSLYFFHLIHGLYSIFNFYTVTAVTLTNWMNFVNSWLTSVTGLPWWLFVLFEFWMVVELKLSWRCTTQWKRWRSYHRLQVPVPTQTLLMWSTSKPTGRRQRHSYLSLALSHENFFSSNRLGDLKQRTFPAKTVPLLVNEVP